MLTDEQAQKVKNKLLEQLENFPEEQRKIIKHKLLSMNNSELEEFLKENQIDESKETKEAPKCIFCSIVKKEIKSSIFFEEKDYIAILELNPLSKGHTLVIPREHISMENLPESAIEFAKKVASIIFSKLSPKDIQFQKNEVLGHGNLEIVPVYGEEKPERHRASDQELSELVSLLAETKGEEKPKIETPAIQEKPKEEKKEELPKIKPRLKWI